MVVSGATNLTCFTKPSWTLVLHNLSCTTCLAHPTWLVLHKEQPDARRPLVAKMRQRLMEVFPEVLVIILGMRLMEVFPKMAAATYPPEVFLDRAVQNGTLSSGWCDLWALVLCFLDVPPLAVQIFSLIVMSLFIEFMVYGLRCANFMKICKTCNVDNIYNIVIWFGECVFIC